MDYVFNVINFSKPYIGRRSSTVHDEGYKFILIYSSHHFKEYTYYLLYIYFCIIIYYILFSLQINLK